MLQKTDLENYQGWDEENGTFRNSIPNLLTNSYDFSEFLLYSNIPLRTTTTHMLTQSDRNGRQLYEICRVNLPKSPFDISKHLTMSVLY